MTFRQWVGRDPRHLFWQNKFTEGNTWRCPQASSTASLSHSLTFFSLKGFCEWNTHVGVELADLCALQSASELQMGTSLRCSREVQFPCYGNVVSSSICCPCPGMHRIHKCVHTQSTFSWKEERQISPFLALTLPSFSLHSPVLSNFFKPKIYCDEFFCLFVSRVNEVENRVREWVALGFVPPAMRIWCHWGL